MQFGQEDNQFHAIGGLLDRIESLARASGFKILARHACMFSTITRKLGFSSPFDRMPIVKLDWLLSEAFRWNSRYWRDTFSKKLAPSSAFWIVERPKP